MTAPGHVAIIGCGFSGTSAFFQLVDRYPVEEITIFETSGEFGPGYPYRPDECQDYLINNATDTMCLVSSNRRGFVEWLANRPDLAPDLDGRGYLPRSLFGAFLKDVFASTQTAAAVKGIKVNLIPFEATSMQETDAGNVRIGWTNGEVAADVALLTTGRCPDRNDYEYPPENSSARYEATHVMSPDLDNLPNDATVHILGASLSAYDVINRLFSTDTGCRFNRAPNGQLLFEPGTNQRRVVLCSRSGRLKAMQSLQREPMERMHFTREALRDSAGGKGLTLGAVVSLVRDEADHQDAEIDWETVLDPYRQCATAVEVSQRAGDLLIGAIRAATSSDRQNFLVDLYEDAQLDIWDSFAEHLLTADDEQKYRSRFETAMLSYAAPCPVPTAEKLLALHQAGKLTVIKGVRDIELLDDGSAYEITHDFGSEAATVLVNATGATERNVESPSQSALIRSMADKGLLRPYQRNGVLLNGAAVDMKTFRSEGARNIYIANMLLWGPGFFTSSALMMATIVERIIESLYETTEVKAEHCS